MDRIIKEKQNITLGIGHSRKKNNPSPFHFDYNRAGAQPKLCPIPLSLCPIVPETHYQDEVTKID